MLGPRPVKLLLAFSIAFIITFQAYSYLEVSNDHGKNSFDFELTFTPHPPPLVSTGRPPFSEEDPSTDDGLGMMAIVAIVVSVALVLIIVAIVVILMYKKELACFGNPR